MISRIVMILSLFSVGLLCTACPPEKIGRVTTTPVSPNTPGTSQPVVKPRDCRTMCVVGSMLFTSSVEGLFSSSDFGKTWSKIGIELASPTTEIGFITMQAGVLFAAEFHSGGGLYRSLDTGKTWEISLDKNYLLHTSMSPQTIMQYGDAIGDTLLVAVQEKIMGGSVSRIYLSDNKGHPNSWSPVFSVPYPNFNVLRDISVLGSQVFAFTNTTIVYGAMLSTSPDTWKEITRIPDVEYLNTSLVYNSSQILTACSDGVYSSINNCRTWESVSLGLGAGEAGPLVTNGQDVFAAVHTRTGAFVGVYWKQQNQERWKKITSGIPNTTTTGDNASYIQTMAATRTHLFLGTHGDGVITVKLNEILP